jgi:hypothetical protein
VLGRVDVTRVLVVLVLTGCRGTVEGRGPDPDCTTCEPGEDAGAIPAGDGGVVPGLDGAVTGSDASGRDGGAVIVPDGSPAFMVLGHLGRLMLTCDAGDTFVFDTSKDPAAHCWNMSGGTGPDCDHQTWAGVGIAYGGGHFAATFGWGEEGEGHGIYVSTDGDDGGPWTEVLNGSFNGVAYGDGVWVAGNGGPGVSTDDGETWRRLENYHYETPRGTVFAPVMGGRFVIAADGPTLLVSDDGARTFFEPETVSPDCGPLGAGGGSAIVMYQSDQSALCLSTDGGHTFTSVSVGGALRSRAVWTGTEIWIWGDGVRYSSADGRTWTERATEGGARFHHVARADDGTLLAVESEWGSYYESSAFWRSRDGLVWERTAGSDRANGHPIRGITFGYVPAVACE